MCFTTRATLSISTNVTDARRALREISPGVDRWLGDADKIIVEEETSFNEETVAAKAACYNGWLPNLKCRHNLGRKAKKMTEKVDKLLVTAPTTVPRPPRLPEVQFQLGTNLHEGASSSGILNHEQPPASEGKNIEFGSRRSIVEDVMEALRGNQFNPIVICGLGGIGKTTLMGQVHDRAKKEGLFDEYTTATFKESLDVIQIQGELAEYLGKQLLENENQIGPRASKLSERLSQGSKEILVMLDNVSTTTPNLLWHIGFPIPLPPSCQLLVTSRQQDVFKGMDRRKIFPIDGLSDADAWSLFEKTAGSCIKTDRELHVVAEKILKKCGGLPIAISSSRSYLYSYI